MFLEGFLALDGRHGRLVDIGIGVFACHICKVCDFSCFETSKSSCQVGCLRRSKSEGQPSLGDLGGGLRGLAAVINVYFPTTFKTVFHLMLALTNIDLLLLLCYLIPPKLSTLTWKV